MNLARLRPLAALAVLAAAHAACFSPSYDAPACSPAGDCPDGLTCVAGTCQTGAAVDGAIDVGLDVDASEDPDASTIDAAPLVFPADCDYIEQSDAANDSGAEGTGITIPALPDSVVLCGSFAARVPISSQIDTDQFQLVTTGDVPVIARLTLEGANGYAQVLMNVGAQQQGSVSLLSGDHAVDVGASAGGTINIGVAARNPTLVAETIYKIRIQVDDPADRCPATVTASYTEVLDTVANGQTGNDHVSIMFSGTATLSANPDDVPEPSGLTIAPAAKFQLQGTAANTAALPDQYKDRDSFLVTTGASTNEMDLALNWLDVAGTTDDADLDYFVLDAETLGVVSTGIQVGFANFERGLMAVAPSTTYLVIAASWNDALADKPYTFDLCGLTYP
jgi:hypothetical protein